MERDALSVVSEASARAGVTAERARRGSFRALRSRPFRLYFIGQVASASGTFLQQTAIGWLVLKLTGNAAALGLVLAVGGVPSLLFGPWGGSIADRVDLRRLLIGTQLAFGLLAGLLWALALTGHATVPVIIALSVASGVVSIADSPARQAFITYGPDGPGGPAAARPLWPSGRGGGWPGARRLSRRAGDAPGSGRGSGG